MSKQTVYKASQLPDSIESDKVSWTGDDYQIWVEKTENNKIRLKGEYLEYDEEEEDWTESPISRDECIDIAEREQLILPTDEGMKKITDIFKRK